ncbi:MAG: Rrf2 family transcriptional regulator [Candidatus Aegiribacteria sp.]|nr:Rrf2 family transcriptional regulator [Candidatus Aegiribacteria sp.]
MSSPVTIPESVSLAIHALAKLSSSNREHVVLSDLLLRPGSAHHLSKVLQKLTHAGIVTSKRGHGGGFSIAVHPSDIRLMDVWIALEGPFVTSICPYSWLGCELPSCLFGTVIEDASNLVRKYFTDHTVADLGRLFEGK